MSFQVVRLADILRCHSDAIPYFVTFTLRSQTDESTRSKAFLEAVVVVKQVKNHADVKIDIAMNLDHDWTDNGIVETEGKLIKGKCRHRLIFLS